MKICPVCGLQVEDEARFCPRDGALLEQQVTDPFLGKVLLGQFEVEEIIGQGTTGSVYRARQLRMDRPVAVKVLRPELAREPVVVERFHREAKAVAKLSHPNIITVHLVAETEQGLPYLVMEYVQGEDLQALLAREAPLPTDRIVELGAQIAEALAEAHAQGIVHRDLKPANIKLAERGGRTVIKVLDFGIAKILQEDSQGKLTKTGTVFGTPHYVSPEQASGAKVDHHTDIYSLGVILFQMATGRLPFESSSGLEVLVKHIKETPPRPSEIVGKVHPGLERLILKALAKDPTQRQASADVVARELGSLTGSAKSPPGAPAKSVQTLDMTGWQKKVHRGNQPHSAGNSPKTGTKLAFGGTGRQTASVAEQVAQRASQTMKSATSDGETMESSVPGRPGPSSVTVTSSSLEHRAHGRMDAPLGDVPQDSGVVLEPATDYASGRATSMDIRSVSQIARAPDPVSRIPRKSDTFVDDAPPPPDPDTLQPAPSVSQGGIHGTKGDHAPPVRNHRPTGPTQQDRPPHPVQQPSDWSMSDMKRYRPGKGLWIALSIAILLGAGAAGAFVWYRHRQASADKNSPSHPTRPKETATKPDAGPNLSKPRDAAPPPDKPVNTTMTKGTRLAVGGRKGNVTIEGTTLSLTLSQPAKAGRRSRIVLAVRGGSTSALGADLVTPQGELTSIRLEQKGKRYHAVIPWKTAGLHRLVIRYDTTGHKAMVWFSIPVVGKKNHGTLHPRRRRRHASPEVVDPFSDEPPANAPVRPSPHQPRRSPESPHPGDGVLPIPPDEPPTTPPPRRTKPRPSDDLPPPPPDEGP